jgi:hypothetical protein
MNDRDPDFATKAVAIIELLLNSPRRHILAASAGRYSGQQ